MHKKERGQHFLIDKKLAHEIVKFCSLNHTDRVLEIGPGEGILTTLLSKRARSVTAVEIDRRLIPDLEQQFRKSNVRIIKGNGIDYVDKSFDKIVSNTPYLISEPLVFGLIYSNADIILTLPDTFIGRLRAKPEEPLYSSLSFFFQGYFEIEMGLVFPKEATKPPGKPAHVVRFKKQLKKDPLHYFARQLYKRKKSKFKNALRETLIDYNKDILKKPLTKNSAREIIKACNLNTISEKNPIAFSTTDIKHVVQAIHQVVQAKT